MQPNAPQCIDELEEAAGCDGRRSNRSQVSDAECRPEPFDEMVIRLHSCAVMPGLLLLGAFTPLLR
jgi:hypothetical protein